MYWKRVENGRFFFAPFAVKAFARKYCPPSLWEGVRGRARRMDQMPGALSQRERG